MRLFKSWTSIPQNSHFTSPQFTITASWNVDCIYPASSKIYNRTHPGPRPFGAPLLPTLTRPSVDALMIQLWDLLVASFYKQGISWGHSTSGTTLAQLWESSKVADTMTGEPGTLKGGPAGLESLNWGIMCPCMGSC